jgi:hypothetical protein
MNKNIDQLAMLLSTDWFLNFWPSLGLQSPLASRLKMKDRCRDIVVDFFAGESDYWLVSFDDSRIRSTYDSFFAAAAAVKLIGRDVEFLRRIANQTATDLADAEQNELLESLTQLLVSDRDPDVIKHLPLHLIETVSLIYLDIKNANVDFVSFSMRSGTKWDQQIRNMTSGLPEYLADFASSLTSQTMSFPKFWGALTNNIASQSELQLLIRWYEETAMELVNRQLELTHLVP